MTRKGKAWLHRVLGVTIAAVLVLQPVLPSFSPISVVHAAESTELIENGDFSNGSANWAANTGGSTVKFENNKAIYTITNVGDLNWFNFLKYEGINLKSGQDYDISFNVKSSVARTIEYGFDRNKIGSGTINLEAEKETSVSYTFTSSIDFDNEWYMIYLGNIPGGTNPTEEHTVEISNVSIKTTADTTDGNNGNEGGETTVTEVPSAPVGIVAGYWENADVNHGMIRIAWGVNSAVTEYVVSIDGKEVGTATGGELYVENTYAAGNHTVSIVAKNSAGSSEAGTATFTLTAAQAVEGGTGGTGGNGSTGSGGNETDDASQNELIENGNFSDVATDGTSATNWQTFVVGQSTVKFDGGKAIFNVDGTSGDYQPGLKYTKGIDVEANKSYEISFTAKSSVERTIQYGFDSPRHGAYTTNLNANEETKISYTYTPTVTQAANAYMIYLGEMQGEGVINPTAAHTVEISNVSIKTATDSDNSGNEGDKEDSNTGSTSYVAVGENLVTNGDFTNGSEGWTPRDKNATITWNEGSTSFNITGEAQDWEQSICQTIAFEQGAKYRVSFDIESSIARTVSADIADKSPREFTSKEIPANTKTTLTYDTTATAAERTFFIYLGGVSDAHTVTVSNVSIMKLAENLVTNGDFANKDKGWSNFSDLATITWNEGNVVFNINQNSPNDYGQSIYQMVSLESGVEYQVSFDIESSVARTVKAGFDNTGTRDEFKSDTIPANTKTTLTYNTTNAIPGDNKFMIYLGSDVGAHTVTISNVSIVKADGTSGGNEGSGEPTVPEGADTEDGEPVEAVEGNLLKNGNFENKEENWSVWKNNAEVYFNKYRTVFQINGETDDYGQGLYQEVELTSGPTYKVSFDIETTVERTVTVDINDYGREFTSEVIPANTKTTISYETKDVNNDNSKNKFFIYLGGVKGLGNHKVVISNVSIVEMPVELPNDENDTAPAALTSLKGINVDDAIALKDGKFTAGLNNWSTYCVDWMETWNVVQYTPVEDGMSVYIKNVGDGEGNKAEDVQLNQNIDLKKNLEYTISFDVHSEKARAINIVINELGTGNFSKTIGLQKDESRHVVFNIPKQSEDALNKLFSIQMGKVNGDVLANTLTFTNMKIEVNGCEELAERVTDGKFTDGFGAFKAATTDAAAITVDNKSVLAEITSNTQAEDVTLTRDGIELEAGVTYSLSFMAGAKSGNRDITVKLPDGTSKEFTLTDEATLYTVDVTPTANVSSGEIAFLLGGVEDSIALDTVYLNAKGYAEATGINLEQHDIELLTKFTPPVISEMINAVEGNDVVLTYDDPDSAYTDAITAIKVNGTVIDNSKYVLEQGKVTLDKSLFTVSGERQAYTIEVDAYWYEKNEAIQIVYKTAQWKLNWQDEFNGSSLNMEKWSYQEGTGAEYGIEGWGNNEQQYYTRDNLKVDDGTLTITATTEDRGGKPYSSARIWTMNDDQKTAKFAQTYGRFEAKIKMPAGEGSQGLWPAFWLLPEDSPYGSWPVSGEIDIMEARGREGDRTDSTLHYGKTYPNEAAEGKSYVWEDDALAITDYHIYSVDWTPTYMSFQVDGEEFYRATNWYCQGEGEPQKYAFPAPFDQDFYIILNLAVGGMYDGNRNPSDSALPAEMKVDYVRVYESTTPYGDDYIAPEPELEKDDVPADAKTYLIDPDFTDVKTVINDTDEKNVNGWNLLTLSQFGGAANFETTNIDGDTFAKINITNTGSANYSVQLTQKLSLYKGHWYTLSFDAKADTAREIIAKIGGDGTNSWSAYQASTAKLTKNVQHYEYTFQMLNDSDPSSRLEMNMGLGVPTSVYIGNIEFKEVDGYVINADAQKSPLEDGNHIYNGNFMTGDSSRLAYWHVSDSESGVVKKGSEYFFRSQNATTLYQTGIEMLQSDTYKLTVDAKADAEQTIEIIFSDADGKEYAKETITVGTTKENKEVRFTMPSGVTDKNGVVTFKMDAGVELDNIVMTRETFNNVDYSGLNCYPLTNGDFELGSLGWSTHQTTLSLEEENDNHFGRAAGKVGGNRWDAMLIYSDLNLVGGYLYEFSFDAKADKETAFDVVLEDGSYTRQFAKTDLAVGTEWKNYSYTFKLPTDTVVALKYLLGGASEAYNLDVDNVVLQMKGAPEESGSFLPNAYNKIGEELVITHSGTADWTDKAVITLDGTELTKDQYSFNGSTIKLDKSLVSASKEYTISAKAEGYADTTPVKFRMYPANGDRICNGNISYGDTAWKTYIHNGNCATLEYDKGHLVVHYDHAEADQWGIIPWAIQWNQDVTLDKKGDYVITFSAYSEVEREILVTLTEKITKVGKSTKVRLTKVPKLYQVKVNVETAGSYEVLFQMGATNPDTDNGYWSPDGFVDFGPHDLYLDGISMLPADTDTDTGTDADTSEEDVIVPIFVTESVEEDIPNITDFKMDKEYASQLLQDILTEKGIEAEADIMYTFIPEKEIIDIETNEDEKIADDIEMIQAAALSRNLKIGSYLDINLIVYATGNEIGRISELNEKTPAYLMITIPEDLRKENRVFSVIRVHDGTVDVLNDLNQDSDPNTIEIETNKFSTYAIVYKDSIPVDRPANSGDNTDNNNTNNNHTGDITNITTIKDKESKIIMESAEGDDRKRLDAFVDLVKADPNEETDVESSIKIDNSISSSETEESESSDATITESDEAEVSSQIENEADTSDSTAEKATNTWWLIVLVVFAVLAVATGAMVVIARKKEREE